MSGKIVCTASFERLEALITAAGDFVGQVVMLRTHECAHVMMITQPVRGVRRGYAPLGTYLVLEDMFVRMHELDPLVASLAIESQSQLDTILSNSVMSHSVASVDLDGLRSWLSRLRESAEAIRPRKKRTNRWTTKDADRLLRAHLLMLAKDDTPVPTLRELEEVLTIPRSTLQQTDTWQNIRRERCSARTIVNHDWVASEACVQGGDSAGE